VNAALLVSVVLSFSFIVVLLSKVIPSRVNAPFTSRSPPFAADPPDKLRALLFRVRVVVLSVFKVPATLSPAFSTNAPPRSKVPSAAIVLVLPSTILPIPELLPPIPMLPFVSVRPPDNVKSAVPTLIFSVVLSSVTALLTVKSLVAEPRVKVELFRSRSRKVSPLLLVRMMD